MSIKYGASTLHDRYLKLQTHTQNIVLLFSNGKKIIYANATQFQVYTCIVGLAYNREGVRLISGKI